LRVLIVILAALPSFGTLGSLGAFAFGLSTSRVVTDTQLLPASMRLLSVDTGDLPVTVRLATEVNAKEPRVDLRIVTSTEDMRQALTKDDTGSRVTVRNRGFRFPQYNRAGEIKIILPPSVARELSVTVKQRTGSLSTDADLDQLAAKTDDDAVIPGGSARRVDINVGRGDINTTNSIAVTESFRAETQFGSISVKVPSGAAHYRSGCHRRRDGGAARPGSVSSTRPIQGA
jgi:hypothetical protein